MIRCMLKLALTFEKNRCTENSFVLFGFVVKLILYYLSNTMQVSAFIYNDIITVLSYKMNKLFSQLYATEDYVRQAITIYYSCSESNVYNRLRFLHPRGSSISSVLLAFSGTMLSLLLSVCVLHNVESSSLPS